MKNAFKKMIFFSEIFPKKYQSEFLKELLLSIDRRNINYKRSQNGMNLDYNYQNMDSFTEDPKSQSYMGDGNKTPLPKQKNEFLWSDAYLIIAEENFNSIFKEVYEHEFIDKIFLKQHDSTIKKTEFITAIAGDADEMAKCDWLFSPLKLRNIFMSHIEFSEYKDVIDEYL